jgi:hypothetical protein
MIDWLIDYDGVRLTSQNRGHYCPIVHPPDECEWSAIIMTMAAGKSWFVYQSSLEAVPAK